MSWFQFLCTRIFCVSNTLHISERRLTSSLQIQCSNIHVDYRLLHILSTWLQCMHCGWWIEFDPFRLGIGLLILVLYTDVRQTTDILASELSTVFANNLLYIRNQEKRHDNYIVYYNIPNSFYKYTRHCNCYIQAQWYIQSAVWNSTYMHTCFYTF